MAKVYANANGAAAHHKDTHAAILREAASVELRARQNLAQAHETTRISNKDYFPAEIDSEELGVDRFVILHAPNAMALEFGHDPSGFFDPDGPYLPGNTSRPPAPSYILTRAALI